MRLQRQFWIVYGVVSAVSFGLSLLLFHWFADGLHLPYEDAATAAGLLTMPLNFFAGEQLAWTTYGRMRATRAMRYLSVYGGGLALNVIVIHVLGHVVDVGARVSDVGATLASLGFTAPLHRFWTWRAVTDRRRS